MCLGPRGDAVLGLSERVVSFLLGVIDRSVTGMDRLARLLLRAVDGLMTAIDRLVALIAHAAAGPRGKDHTVNQHARASGNANVFQRGGDIVIGDAPMTNYLPPFGDIRDAVAGGIIRWEPQSEGDDDAELLADEVGPLSTEDEQLVAERAADAINHTLARLFLRLGPPPQNTDGDFAPVSSSGGGSAL
ncbi:hypothetical protein QFZ22_000174 [Streptomyces canus]|uniref:Uncharacterized protein n=1 Tax=Streptomyces canus TaxID=58343 RepID=A0AAW8F289_9ACTN|nr:hypothetical protein [Streptomyces canus]